MSHTEKSKGVMEVSKDDEQQVKKFSVSFRALLKDMAAKRGWLAPVYTRLGRNTARVFLCIPCSSNSHYFEGDQKPCLSDSEEHAAEKAVKSIALQENFCVDDVNYDKKQRYEFVMRHYLAKQKELQNLEKGILGGVGKTSGGSGAVDYSRMVSIDFESLLADVMEYYNMSRTLPEHTEHAHDGHIVAYALYYNGHDTLLEWFASDVSPSLEEAMQSVAKKAVKYVQYVYDFEVRDVNFFDMIAARVNNIIEQELYFNMKSRLIPECTSPRVSVPPVQDRADPPPAPRKEKSKPGIVTLTRDPFTMTPSVPRDLTNVYKRRKLNCASESKA